MPFDLRAIARQFQLYGDFVAAEPYGSGHINDTFCVVVDQAGTRVRYILQRLNHNVFKDPSRLMTNVQRVTAHIGNKLAGQPDASRRVLRLVPTIDGAPFFCADGVHYWRAYLFIEQARTYDAVQSTQQAFEAGKAFGLFQSLLVDLPGPRLNDTILEFHHTPKRFVRLEEAIRADPVNRAVLARSEIEFALARKPVVNGLLQATLPERVTHNDTKFNNVMLDDATGQGICVIDLDTVMTGSALYDFGDLVRTTTCPTREDEPDLSKVHMQFPMFEDLVRGYLGATVGFLTKPERELLAFSGKLITFEIAIRFLTDFLEGDVYFKVHRPHQNLDRTRMQLRLVESIEAQEEQMARFVESQPG
jgi:hypothetical protein